MSCIGGPGMRHFIWMDHSGCKYSISELISEFLFSLFSRYFSVDRLLANSILDSSMYPQKLLAHTQEE